MGADSPIVRAPANLRAAGKALWRSVLADLTEASSPGDEPWELDARELLILEAAARQADTNRALEDVLREHGMVVVGSTGQPRLNAAATEVRQGRIALEKLLSSLALPNGDGEVLTAGQKRGRLAAQARHGVRHG
jgi:hypothetical protein